MKKLTLEEVFLMRVFGLFDDFRSEYAVARLEALRILANSLDKIIDSQKEK